MLSVVSFKMPMCAIQKVIHTSAFAERNSYITLYISQEWIQLDDYHMK